MNERRVLSGQEIVDLVTGLRSLKWSWKAENVERMVAHFGWGILFRAEQDFVLETEFGTATGQVEVREPDQAVRVWVAVSTPVKGENPEQRAFTQGA